MPLIGCPYIVLQSVDSTNNYAMAQVHAGMAKHGTVYFTHEQTSGKGQRGKTWNSEKGENIVVSIVLEPNGFLLSDRFLLNIAVTMACYDLANSSLPGNVFIKWPNDIYWNDRKAGGILIENVLKGNQWRYAIAGIGMNINQVSFPGNLNNPVSFKLVTGNTYNLTALLGQLCDCLEKRYHALVNDRSKLLEEYNSCLYRLNEDVVLKRHNILFHARIKGVSSEGFLIAQTSMEEHFAVGEVEWMR